MKITGSSGNHSSLSLPRLDLSNRATVPPQLRGGNFNGLLSHDRVEISKAGRELAAGSIKTQPAKYYGTTEINESLNRVLQGQPEEVSKAVYGIIESNFMVSDSWNDDQRSALIDIGLSQAKYIADQYMSGDQANEFLNTMNTIANLALTRSVDPETDQVSYAMPEERPAGAPEDYINPESLMKRSDPESYKKFQQDIAGGGNGLEILLDFVKKIPQNPQWTKDYRNQASRAGQSEPQTRPLNRFGSVDTSSFSAYKESMQSLMKQLSLTDGLFERNMENFYQTLGING
ncbi:MULTISPECIES: hypothetical protein [Paenibacillus]|uniref:hypothetical protein n=1 Tax=Paenibacillus TaxID=44249 RepID=UPI002FE0E1C2